jgi:Zn-finger protein
VFEKWKRYEKDGMPCYFEGRNVKFRIVLCSFVSDMKERRELLDSNENVYHCSACYDFPGKEAPESKLLKLRRCTTQDAKLRADFDSLDEVEFNKINGIYGLRLLDKCAFTRTRSSEIFTLTGPAHYLDSIHFT